MFSANARRFLVLRARPLQAGELDLHAQLLDLALELVAIRRVIGVALRGGSGPTLAQSRGPRQCRHRARSLSSTISLTPSAVMPSRCIHEIAVRT
jgi:hypothetical protein